jgi:hypothetical protein
MTEENGSSPSAWTTAIPREKRTIAAKGMANSAPTHSQNILPGDFFFPTSSVFWLFLDKFPNFRGNAVIFVIPEQLAGVR